MERLASSLLFYVANLSYWWEIPVKPRQDSTASATSLDRCREEIHPGSQKQHNPSELALRGHISVSVMNMNHIWERGRKGAMDLRAVVGTKPALSEGTHGPYASKQLVPNNSISCFLQTETQECRQEVTSLLHSIPE